MAEPVLPQKPETTQRLQNDTEKRDVSRVVLPSRTPPIPPRRPPPLSPVTAAPQDQTPLIPLRRPPVSPPQATAPSPLRLVPKPAGDAQAPSKVEPNQLPRRPNAPMTSQAFARASVQPGPKKETARVSMLSRTSPPSAIAQATPGAFATSNSIDAFDSIPGWFCWGLLGLSTLIFIIQIWNYALS